jgi:hypothetical protein
MLGTPASRKVCEEVASLSGEAIFLGFSRGKDSVAAWLWLREFFPRVIPFHCATLPGLGFVERSLTYYEEFFQTPILRCVSADLCMALSDLVYQPCEDEDWIDALALSPAADNDQVVRQLRAAYGLPSAWVAWGISATDSIVRRSAKKYQTGKSEKNRTLYPCFDWPRALILNAIESAGVKLAEDYTMGNRSFAGIPGVRHLDRMRELYPEDFERVKFFYPFCEATLARNDFRRMSVATSNKPSLPDTGIGSTGSTSASTQAQSSALPSSPGQPAAASSTPTRKRRQSTSRTTATATPTGSEP